MQEIKSTFAFANATQTDLTPTLWYRDVSGVQGHPRFEREDRLRPSEPTAIGSSIEDLIDDLHLSIALHTREDVFVHAGVVALNNAAIVIPGRSRAGKSTLVQALVQAGATYLSDEYACVKADGSIAPYARPIHLRSSTGRKRVDAATIGSVANDPVMPRLVLLTRFVRNTNFSPRRVSPSAAALELFDNTVIAEVQPSKATSAVAQIARIAPALRSDRPEASMVAPLILDLVEKMEAPS